MLVRNQQMSTKRFRSYFGAIYLLKMVFKFTPLFEPIRTLEIRASISNQLIYFYFIYSFMVFSISEITFGVEFGNRWSNELSSDGHLAPPSGGRFINTSLNRALSPNRSPNRSPQQKRRLTRMPLGQEWILE